MDGYVTDLRFLPVGILQTKNLTGMAHILINAYEKSAISVGTLPSGQGKTIALEYFTERFREGVYVLSASARYTSKALLRDICQVLGIAQDGTESELFRNIVNFLIKQNGKSIIVVDEANLIVGKPTHFTHLRRIQEDVNKQLKNKAGCGVGIAVIGTASLYNYVYSTGKGDEMEQFRTRVSYEFQGKTMTDEEVITFIRKFKNHYKVEGYDLEDQIFFRNVCKHFKKNTFRWLSLLIWSVLPDYIRGLTDEEKKEMTLTDCFGEAIGLLATMRGK